MLKRDRLAHLQHLAHEAQKAAKSNDLAKAFQLIKLLAGVPLRRLQTLMDEQGNPILDDE
eukprot:3459265-Karenia_brevis.AAC.1